MYVLLNTACPTKSAPFIEWFTFKHDVDRFASSSTECVFMSDVLPVL